MTKIVKKQEQLFNRITSPLMPIQEALTLLRVCALPRLNYLCRTTPASILLPAAQVFDQYMYNSFNSKLNLQLSVNNNTNKGSGSSSNSNSSTSSINSNSNNDTTSSNLTRA